MDEANRRSAQDETPRSGNTVNSETEGEGCGSMTNSPRCAETTARHRNRASVSLGNRRRTVHRIADNIIILPFTVSS